MTDNETGVSAPQQRSGGSMKTMHFLVKVEYRHQPFGTLDSFRVTAATRAAAIAVGWKEARDRGYESGRYMLRAVLEDDVDAARTQPEGSND